MRMTLVFARVYAVLVGAVGFLFGQIFTGDFSLAALLAGVSGVASGLLGVPNTRVERGSAAVLCVVGMVGVAMDAFRYYRDLQIPGSYYPWLLIGPFALALFFIGYRNITANA
jgi:hypothetical protein